MMNLGNFSSSIGIINYRKRNLHLINKNIIEDTKQWLGVDGLSFFMDCYEKYGTVSPTIPHDLYPHSVHFNEGMQVRNFLRQRSDVSEWNCHTFDNMWEVVILLTLELPIEDTQYVKKVSKG